MNNWKSVKRRLRLAWQLIKRHYALLAFSMLSCMLRNNSICVSFLKQDSLTFSSLFGKLTIKFFLLRALPNMFWVGNKVLKIPPMDAFFTRHSAKQLMAMLPFYCKAK